MTAVFQFCIWIKPLPRDEQVQRILALGDAPTVELGPEEDLGKVQFDRPAPTLADAIASAVHDLERIEAWPANVEECDTVTIAEAAARLDRPVEELRRWLAGTRSAPGAPTPYRKRAGAAESERSYSWNELTGWAREWLDSAIPDDAPIITAAGMALRLRRYLRDTPGVQPLVAALLSPPR